ncbi:MULTISPECIES: hypothetical protein [Mycobacteroides]|uniref:hypothetical protein n=1 Tax=Mycobacteroides TaxID=670516 RepID=UPI000926DE68|nr:hypothetical protein [Mycobacteroides abscessus]SHT26687.1 Uncharacterised protein [Mycobacteroides abscessus subsp. abscessus]SHW69957.1 Uncharacterised protein [Mycobacteroides abscessus subsp. abscessus]SHY72279.1 Uncharacterised protein [Mycobacteroides abscessus subsp. abscessus]SHZ42449.1 Uncharacterised protein [Mycobacteroides abscessus subsp. abscessus]SKR90658.1 Uncharacterised protein [Mycobacteroides abscessus subsp. abscessus]
MVAKTGPGGGFLLDDIDVPEYNVAAARWMNTSPVLGGYLAHIGEEVVRLYAAKVAKRTGDLSRSGEVRVLPGGGHKKDRQVAIVTVGGELAAKTWKGAPFYYGVLHNFGSPTKEQFQAHNDLREAVLSLRM